MKYIIDTDIIIAYLRGVPSVVKKLSSLTLDEFSISAITKAELLLGPRNLKGKRAVKAMKTVTDFLNYLEIVSFDSACADIFADVSASLRKKGSKIGDADIIIAATALKNHLTLVTHNQKHFSQINSLPCIDWVE